MLYHARKKQLIMGDTEMDYVTFGRGDKPFIILPGLGDGLQTVKGNALNFSWYYRHFAKIFQVYIFSRKNQLEEEMTTRDMARDQRKAMEMLGLEDAYVMGISQGGMIAQYLAIDYPEGVKKLVIGVSAAKQNPVLQQVIKNWIQMARENKYQELVTDTIKKTFTEEKYKRYKPIIPIISRISRPKSFNRFLIQAQACLTHQAYDELHLIQCPTLIIGGNKDHVVGENTSVEMAEKVNSSKLLIYEGLGHGAYEEAKDFNQQVLDFLLEKYSKEPC